MNNLSGISQLSYQQVVNGKNLTLYQAGLPTFPRNFTRDSIISAILLDNLTMLRDQLEFCAYKQGQKIDSHTGEEKGKIFHEFPGVEIDGFNTMYNACDTNSLFLFGWAQLFEHGGYDELITAHLVHIKLAAQYISRHIQNNLFVEDPIFSEAGKYALKVTYWKDSSIMHRENGQPNYPVTYTLAQMQAIAGLRSAQKILLTDEFEKDIESLVTGLHSLYDDEHHVFAIIRDTQGAIYLESDDLLHGLMYLEPGDLRPEEIQSIVDMVPILETPFGFRTNSKDYCDVHDSYHSCALWPFEQAIIYRGAQLFGLTQIMEIAQRIVGKLETDPEYLHLVDDVSYEARGCDPQLWTMACKQFFETVI
jgi:glycogen debranching enzyme